MKLLKFAVFLLICLIAPVKVLGAAGDKEEYMISFQQQIDKSLIDKYNLDVIEDYDSIEVIVANLNENTVESLQKEPSIHTIQKNKPYKIQTQTVTWGIKKIHENINYPSPFTGEGIKVAVLDTGIDQNHPDLKVKGGACVLKTSCYDGYNDDNGHGTHVAGVIAALNNTIGVVGVAPDVDLYAIKSFDYFGDGTTNSIVAGVDWAIKNDIDIINFSVTTNSNDAILKMVLQKASDAGIILVAASGNDGDPFGKTNTIRYPAKYENVIAVGSVDSRLVRVPSSGSGAELEVVAPGENIYSTYPKELDFDSINDGYTLMSGTSMATPFVTGVLAQLKQQYPDHSSQEIRRLLQTQAKDLGIAGRDSLYGFGLVQIKKFDPVLPDRLDAKLLDTYKGEVEFKIEKPDHIKKVTVRRLGGKIKDITNQSIWKSYVQAGDHSYLFSFFDDQNKKYQKIIQVKTESPTFEDVRPSDWFNEHMVFLTNKNILKGLNGGTKLNPAANISRGEAIALVGRAIHLNGEQRETVFKDVTKGYFASGYIQSAFEKQIISGFTDSTYRANQPVTRAEMGILISNAYNLDPGNHNPFSDLSPSMAGYKEILALAHSNITKGYLNGTFAPHKHITRAEFAVFLARAENPDFKE